MSGSCMTKAYIYIDREETTDAISKWEYILKTASLFLTHTICPGFCSDVWVICHDWSSIFGTSLLNFRLLFLIIIFRKKTPLNNIWFWSQMSICEGDSLYTDISALLQELGAVTFCSCSPQSASARSFDSRLLTDGYSQHKICQFLKMTVF